MVNDERRVGVPRQIPLASPTLEGDDVSQTFGFVPTTADQAIAEKRVGVPSQRPLEFTRVSVPVTPLAEAARDVEKEVAETSEDNQDGWRRVLRSPLLTTLLVFALSAVFIVVLSEVFQFVQAIQAAPFVLQIAAYCCVGILALAFCVAAFRLVLTYRKLGTTPQILIPAPNDAASRAITREQLSRQLDAGYEAMRAIVEQYPIHVADQVKLLKRSGLTDEDIVILRDNIRSLLEKEGVGKAKWLADCESLFIAMLDRCAKKRVSDYAQRVAIKTAMMPTGLGDSLIVCANAVFLVEELCRIYFVRTSLGNSALLAARLAFNTFISAKLEDRIDEVSDTLFEGAIGGCAEIWKEIVGKVALGVLKRATEGTANLVLFYRLGSAAIVMLRPIRLH